MGTGGGGGSLKAATTFCCKHFWKTVFRRQFVQTKRINKHEVATTTTTINNSKCDKHKNGAKGAKITTKDISGAELSTLCAQRCVKNQWSCLLQEATTTTLTTATLLHTSLSTLQLYIHIKYNIPVLNWDQSELIRPSSDAERGLNKNEISLTAIAPANTL